MISELERASLLVGHKQVMRAFKDGRVKRAFLAEDSDDVICESVKEMCDKANVSLEVVSTKKQLGKICEIDVKASCAVVVN